MSNRILADVAASITELANPMKVATSAYGEPVAVLNRNEPAFYCVPAEAYEMMLDRLEDLELLAIARERESKKVFRLVLMIYKLDFKKSALKEWNKLGSTLQLQFKKAQRTLGKPTSMLQALWC